MPASAALTTTDSLTAVQEVLEATRGDADRFAETLRHRQIPHLSFSQITTVEFCPRRYYLTYVALADLDPPPDYFTKGKLLHQCLAESYQRAARGEPPDWTALQRAAEEPSGEEARRHLRNALELAREHHWQDCQVVAVEQPFVMLLADDLPPCVGVIDLILRRNGHYIVVDHKTGRDFYPQDELQMAIYVEYIRRAYGGGECEFYYDTYRWVNNLSRIRKPAFQREAVKLHPHAWEKAVQRIREGNRAIQRIRAADDGAAVGECYRCPLRRLCRG